MTRNIEGTTLVGYWKIDCYLPNHSYTFDSILDKIILSYFIFE